MAMKELYVRRNRVAANLRQKARRMEKSTGNTESRLAESERELVGMTRPVDMTTEKWARCRGKLQSWAEW